MVDEPRQPVAGRLRSVGELAAWVLMMIGGSFLPGIAIALCVVVALAIAHLVS
ncbi:MAG TPA: hypothetical protein VFW09_04335 [Solirubrobacteraceae bacterium]|nr:hypothetical protein [Solirubrobacteraceae bacterium]